MRRRERPSDSGGRMHRRRKTPGPSLPRPGGTVPPQFAAASRGIRLQKALAAAGVASRRDCEQMVLDGRVKVDGQTVDALPAWVNPRADRITVDGRLINPNASGKEPVPGAAAPHHATGRVYVMLNKPRRVISTTRDDAGRRSLADLVQIKGVGGDRRLFPVGRLDAQSTGLILMTDDGELANRLTHPRYGVAREYLVAIKGAIPETYLQKLRHLLRRPGDAKDPVEVLDQDMGKSAGGRTVLRVTLAEGKNKTLRLLLARFGLKIHRLKSVAIGPLRLKGIGSGNWRMLNPREIRDLRRAAGLK